METVKKLLYCPNQLNGIKQKLYSFEKKNTPNDYIIKKGYFIRFFFFIPLMLLGSNAETIQQSLKNIFRENPVANRDTKVTQD